MVLKQDSQLESSGNGSSDIQGTLCCFSASNLRTGWRRWLLILFRFSISWFRSLTLKRGWALRASGTIRIKAVGTFATLASKPPQPWYMASGEIHRELPSGMFMKNGHGWETTAIAAMADCWRRGKRIRASGVVVPENFQCFEPTNTCGHLDYLKNLCIFKESKSNCGTSGMKQLSVSSALGFDLRLTD